MMLTRDRDRAACGGSRRKQDPGQPGWPSLSAGDSEATARAGRQSQLKLPVSQGCVGGAAHRRRRSAAQRARRRLPCVTTCVTVTVRTDCPGHVRHAVDSESGLSLSGTVTVGGDS